MRPDFFRFLRLAVLVGCLSAAAITAVSISAASADDAAAAETGPPGATQRASVGVGPDPLERQGPEERQARIDRQRAWAHVRRVLLHAEYGTQTGRVQRWSLAPRWMVIGGTEADRHYVAGLIDEINQTLEGTGLVLTPTDNVGLADIGIVIRPAAQFAEIAAMNGFRFREGGVGFAGLVMGRRGDLAGALVLVADELTGAERQATIVQELLHAIGPVNDSPHFPDSVLFEFGRRGSAATRLAPIDRQLIRFLYRRLTPGDDEATVRRLFDRYWALDF